METPIWESLDFIHNDVIEASAGTGKTFTLEKIVERLVTKDGYDIRQILLVTFTEKAAGELKERIRKALEKLVIDIKFNDLAQKALEHLPDATICTIHAFCREVLADYPFESGMMMELGDVGNDNALYQQAVHNVLTSREFQKDYKDKFAQLMKDWDADGDTETIKNAVADKLKKEIIKKDCIQDYLGKLFKQFEDIVKALPHENEWKPGDFVIAKANAGNILGSGRNNKEQYKIFFNELDAKLSICKDFFEKLKLDENLQIVQDEPGRLQKIVFALDFIAKGKVDFKIGEWDGVKQVKKDEKGNVILGEKGKEESLTFCELPGYESYKEFIKMAGNLKKEILLHDIVVRSYHEFIRIKLRSNSVTYDDLIRNTARLVKEATAENADDAKKAFVNRMREHYKIALVDEFQDTDREQWIIFNKLFAAVGHLIVVGDPKQAIYGWRGADLGTYLKAKKELLDKGGKFDALTEMFRSTPKLVVDYDTLFGKSGWFDNMEEGNDPISYTDVSFPKYEDYPEKKPAKVKALEDFTYPHDEKPVELLEAASGLEAFLKNSANEMIRLHQDKVWKKEMDKIGQQTGGKWEPQMDWKDMCVLVRSHPDGVKARDILTAKRIPCRIYKEPGAFDGVEAESILALFDYLSRSRSLGNLSALLLTPLWDVNPKELEERLKKGDAGFDKLCTRWRTYAQKRDWNHLFESVIRNTKIRQNPSGYRQIFDTLLAKYGHAQSLSELATVLRQLKSGDEDAGENGTYRNRASEESAVQIMTIHAAKGLEANAVFVAAGFTGKRPEENEEKFIQESKRLFYVALTRAVFKLYLPWPVPEKLSDTAPLKIDNFLGKAIQKLLEGGDRRMRDPGTQKIEQSDISNQSSNDEKKEKAPPSRGMKGWRFKWDSFSSLGHPNKKEAEASGDNKHPDEPAEDSKHQPTSLVSKGAASGTVFHEVMERLCANDGTGDCIGFEIGNTNDFNTLIDEKDGRKSSLLEIVRRRLAANGVPNCVGKNEGESTAISLARMAWNALRTELDFNGDKFRLCDIGPKDRKAEVNFVIDEKQLLGNCKDREGALNGSIDLLVRHNGEYYIIDWKTNSLDDYKDETVKQAMDDAGYHWQYKIYILAAENWLGAKIKGIAYLFVRGGEFEDDRPSGKFIYAMNEEEREEFKKKLADRLAENDEEEENKDQEEQE